MLNRRFTAAISALLAVIILAVPAMAQEAKKFAVMPFTYNGPQKYAYFPKAFQASLNSDLEWNGHTQPVSDSQVKNFTAPTNKAEALDLLRGSALDYVVTGSIAILGDEATLSMKAFGADGKQWENSSQMGIDEITPWLDEQSKSIMGDVFNRPGYGAAAESAKKSDIKDQAVLAPTNSAFIQSGADGYEENSLNPQFRYEGGTESSGRWRSQTLRFFSTSMVVGDANGDGKNEIFILHKTGISAYQYENGKLKLLQKLDMTPNTQYMRIELVDIDRDSIPELVVASYQSYYRKTTSAPEGTIRCHILSFRSGKFEYIVKDYRHFLGVIRMPPTYMPILVSQRKGQIHLFDKRINEAYVKDGEIELGARVTAPEFGNVYNMVYVPDGFGYKYAVLDDFHRLKMYSQTMERLSSSDDDRYNSSGVAISTSDRLLGMGPGTVDEKMTTFNIPFRMLTASLTKKGKYELLVNKDLSVAAQVFERFNYYSQGEIHSLVWDGVGMNLAWKTRRIKGQVSDIGLADLNNDGKKQLVILVNTFTGSMGFNNRKTIIVAYDLNTPPTQ